MECPQCRLFNPPEAVRCDCGYNFNTGQRGPRTTENSLTVFDWALVILAPLIALILALGWRAQGRPKAGQVIRYSAVWMLILLAVRIIWVLTLAQEK